MVGFKDKIVRVAHGHSEDRIEEALYGGGLVVFATESSYGIAARIDRPDALVRLSKLKNRPAGSPLGTVALNYEIVAELCDFPGALETLAKRWWPGPLTLALPPKKNVHESLLSGAGTMGVRVSPHEVCGLLCRLAGGAVTATSANLRGEEAAHSVEELSAALIAGVDLVVDSGPALGGEASTVAGWGPEGLLLFREGAVAKQTILDHLIAEGYGHG